MLNPAYLAGCSDDVAKLFAQLDADITCDIARRVAKMGKYSDTSMWQAQKLREASAAYSMCQQLLKSCKKSANVGIRDMFIAGANEALKIDDRIYRAAGLHPTSITSSQALMDVILAGLQKTNGVMDNLTMTTARDASHSIQNALDRAYMQVMSGAFSYDQAARGVINDLGKHGYTVYNYDSGTRTSLEAATRRALLTGLNQTTAQLQLARANELNSDLVEVSSHAGARPTHAEWQGQIYSLSGSSSRYDNFYDATDYGFGDGLCGWNCYHNFYPYIEGISTPSFERDPTARLGKTNDELYEETQTQRYLERQVRASRRECSTLNTAMGAADDVLAEALHQDFQKASVILKRREARLQAYCKQHNLTYDDSRVVTYNFGRSASAKAVWANRKASNLTSRIDSGIMKIGATKEEVRAYIRSDFVSKTINPEKQSRHIRNSSGYVAGRSYIFGSQKAAQELVYTYHGTGDPQFTKKGIWKQKEVIIADHDIGVAINLRTGKATITNRLTIHYSKTGVHLVPIEREVK